MGFLFASPWIICFLCFTIIPISLALYYSFTNYNLFNKCDWIGLKNYADMFKDKYIWKSLWNTFYVTIIANTTVRWAWSICSVCGTCWTGSNRSGDHRDRRRRVQGG